MIKYGIEIEGILLQEACTNKVYLYDTKEKAQSVIDHLNKVHSSSNHTKEIIQKKNRKGKIVEDIIFTQKKTEIVECKISDINEMRYPKSLVYIFGFSCIIDAITAITSIVFSYLEYKLATMISYIIFMVSSLTTLTCGAMANEYPPIVEDNRIMERVNLYDRDRLQR